MIIESATFGPRESGVDCALPSPITRVFALLVIFIYFKKLVNSLVNTFSTLSWLVLSVTSSKVIVIYLPGFLLQYLEFSSEIIISVTQISSIFLVFVSIFPSLESFKLSINKSVLTSYLLKSISCAILFTYNYY